MSDSVRPHRRQPTRLPHPWDSPGKKYVEQYLLNSWVIFKHERSHHEIMKIVNFLTLYLYNIVCRQNFLHFFLGLSEGLLIFSGALAHTFYFIFLMYLFIFGRVGSLLLCMGFLYLWCVGATLLFCAASSLGWPLLLWSTGSRVKAQKLWCMGLVAPWHVESSWTRDWPSLSCTGRQILNYWTTREVWLIHSKDDRKDLKK